MTKGFNPNPKPGRIYSSIMSQIKLLIRRLEKGENIVPVFQTTNNRFPVLKQVVRDLALMEPNLHFQIFEDCSCVITERIPLKKLFDYVWVEQSTISLKWLVMASPPGALRYDCLTVWKQESDARQLASDILYIINNFPLVEWNKKYESEYYRNFLRSLPFDEDSITGLINDDGVMNFDINTQNELEADFHKLLRSEISKEEYSLLLSEIVEKHKNS